MLTIFSTWTCLGLLQEAELLGQASVSGMSPVSWAGPGEGRGMSRGVGAMTELSGLCAPSSWTLTSKQTDLQHRTTDTAQDA